MKNSDVELVHRILDGTVSESPFQRKPSTSENEMDISYDPLMLETHGKT